MTKSKNKKEVLAELFKRIYSEDHRAEVEHIISNLKSEFEQLSGVNAFVTARTKNPISIIKKFYTKDEYGQEWNKMKDLIGLMVVVDSNNDVDDILHYITTEYGEKKNPNSEKLYKDYRVINIRDDKDKDKVAVGAYEPLSDKGYQTCDGYKNVRANLMIDGYPIEIQIKTREQYVAHEATHDPVYKAPSIKDEKTRQSISDKLFPYFEAHAYLNFHMKDMSNREIEVWKKDLLEIIERNDEFYNQYREIFEDASRVYAFYLFMTNNMKNIYKDSVFGNSTLNIKLLEIEIKRIFHYLEKKIATEDPSLTSGKIFNQTIEQIAKLSYEEFIKIRNELAGSYRCEKCIVSGVYDLLREKDVDLFKRLSESFRYVEVGVYDDELAKIFLGKDPMFSLEDRQAALRSLKGISSLYTVSSDGSMKSSESIEYLSVDPLEEKSITVNLIPREINELLKEKSKKDLDNMEIQVREKAIRIGYLPGVFDMLHPGHVEYINQVCRLCDEVYIGSKSDEYVRIIKKKDPVLDSQERTKILQAIRGIISVNLTEFDIIPSRDILDKMIDENKKGKQCAIFMGSDWVNKANAKSPRSLSEYEYLIKHFPFIKLLSIPRGNSGRSSSNYKPQGINSLNDINPYEFTIFDR